MSQEHGPFGDRRWFVDAATIGASRQGRIEATVEEAEAAARRLDLLGCRDLALDYDVVPMAGGRPGCFRLTAKLSADVEQACVVTLDPVPSRCVERIELELHPAGTAESVAGRETLDVLSTRESEAYEGGRIELGQLAFELLSVALDPYPRVPGAALADAQGADRQALSPFASLAKLRKP